MDSNDSNNKDKFLCSGAWPDNMEITRSDLQ